MALDFTALILSSAKLMRECHVGGKEKKFGLIQGGGSMVRPLSSQTEPVKGRLSDQF
jgi:hypothetical protein